jgi:hypothetical protein
VGAVAVHDGQVRRLRPFLPFLPVGVVLVAVAVLRPGMIASGAGSWRAQLLGAGVFAAGAATWLVARRFTRAAAPWLSSAVLLALLAWVLWPSFRERTVVEAFPPVEDIAQVQPTSPAAPTTAAPGTTSSPAASSSPAPATAPPVSPTAAARPTATAVMARRISTGTFRGIDHSASGRASLYDVAGSVMLRFEDIDFQGTPKPSVHLVARGKGSPDGGIRLGALKGEHGSFSYTTPPGFDATKGWKVLVWCDAFDVPIAAADLA